MRTGFHYDPLYLEHHAGAQHPECPQRLQTSLAHLERCDWFDSLIALPAQAALLDWIHTVHAPDYVARARQACNNGQPYLDVPDVGISARSFDAALLASGAMLAVADAVMEGAVDNAFSLSRPPGHHAEAGMALGFCLFNNVAISARYLQQHHGLEKILILDWDVHHGNGTQHTFESDPSVMYASLHQYPYYPGTGAYSEQGDGAGKGATVNCPMPAGAGDQDYQKAFSERLLPAFETFAPDAVIVSAGFDAHGADPLAGIQLSTGCYTWMSERMMEVADKHASGRLLSVLEGGYSLQALPLCIETHLNVLRGSAV
ncbi:MAG: histone deacetylase [Gammaproteobacteria bacterium]|nr:histone deacetylase [Gammaproteobacteria bacterium]